MTRRDQISGKTTYDWKCAECTLNLLDALAWASDSDLFRVNYYTGISMDKLWSAHILCREACRSEAGFRFDTWHDLHQSESSSHAEILMKS